MVDIYEVELNLCDYHGTIQCDDIKELYEFFLKKVRDITDVQVHYVRLGYEFCENGLLHTNSDKLLENMQWLNAQGLKIVFVLPPLHQRYMEMYRIFLLKLLEYEWVNEFVVNDIGAIQLIREELGWNGRVSFGRLFDKSIREIRFDVFEHWNSEKCSELAFSPSVINTYQKDLAKLWNIQSMETDTLPDGVLDVEEWGLAYKIHIHYPRILLSKAAYCEFAQNDYQFAGCKGTCLQYGKKIVREDRRMIYKEGLSIYGIQTKPFKDIVKGKVRLIYSEG